MKIAYLDGIRLRQGVIAGARRVILMQDKLNKINVFPVPDNDTGTNMALTMQSIAEGAISCQETSISAMSKCLAEAALMGARGNSGAILAQFFQGLSESFKGQFKITMSHFGEAVQNARKSSYEAITEPQEGTILTVIHDWAENIKKCCQRSHDFLDLLREGLQAAQVSLKNTPSKLKLLAKAGVVDAGAQGFVHMLEGVHHFMESGKIEKAVGIGGKDTKQASVENAPEEISYRYCTECIISGEKIDRTQLRKELTNLGNSLIVAGSAEKVRIHIHTNEPETVFTRAGSFGQVAQQKFEDMRNQHEKAYAENKKTQIALVTDTSCDLPSEYIIRHNIQMVPVQISFGSDNYIDKITITSKEFYRILESSVAMPKTSQPTPGEFKKVYDELWEHYQQAISIHLSGALSGTLQAAKTASSAVNGAQLKVFDSRNVSVGLGLIVAEAARAIEEGLNFEEVGARVSWAIKNVKFFVSFATVDYLIKGGRLSKSRGLLARLLNLKPILTLDKNGKAVTAAKTFGGDMALRKVIQLVCEEAKGKRNLRFSIAHTNAPEQAGKLSGQLVQQFEVKEKDIMVVNVSPALGAHAGPGAAGVAFLGE